MSNYLNAKGAALLNADYAIVPIKKDTKMPGYKNWQQTQATQGQLDDWLVGPFKDGAGVGILSKNCPAIDIDIYDEEIANEIIQYCLENFGAPLIRYGNKPKALLPFRNPPGVTHTKRKSSIYEDIYGDAHAVEILGDGQQWVAYATHPDTKQPYTWTGPDGEPADLTDYNLDELPILTSAMIDDILAFFETVAVREEWDVKRKSTQTTQSSGGFDDLMNAKESLGFSLDKIEQVLNGLDPEKYNTYDDWLKVGMALHHETNGSDDGYALWDAWSMDMPDYDDHELELKWASFDLLGNGNTTTLRSLIHNVNEDKHDNSDRELKQIQEALAAAVDRNTLVRDIPKLIRKAKHLDELALIELEQAYSAQYKMVVGARLPIAQVRSMLERPEEVTKDTAELPAWATDWCYLQDINKYYHFKTRVQRTEKAFNNEFDRELTPPDKMSDPDFRLSQHASDYLVTRGLIPIYAGTLYMPGCGETFTLADRPGLTYVNNYKEKKVTPIPREDWDQEQQDLAFRLDVIMERTGSTPEECLSLRQWFTHKMTHPEKKMQWSVMAVGRPGSGKSVWGEMMTIILGQDNTRVINPDEFGSGYSDWGVGHILGLVEEIKLRGNAKYEILNKIKPNLTNAAIAVRRMYCPPTNEPNCSDFYLTSNFGDSLPIDNSDRRFFILFSHFLTRADVIAADKVLDAGAEEGTWWRRFHELMRDPANTGVLKAWLLETDMTGFNPERAPLSRSRDKMIDLSKGPEQNFIEDLLADEAHPDVSADLLSTKDITRVAMEEHQILNLNTRAMNNILLDMEFSYCARVEIEGDKHQLWSRNSASSNWSNKELKARYLHQKSQVVAHDDFTKKVKKHRHYNLPVGGPRTG